MSEVIHRIHAALGDRYAIERELGSGGMATVYLARDLKHARSVAIKVLRPELAAVLGGERFLKEIEVTAGLQHPHILPLFDSGEAGGFLYYVMPYVEGESLRERLDREKQLGVDEAVRLTVAIASALAYAHRNGVIHRDIKPENVLLHEGQPLVADFGIALAVTQAGGGRITETGLSLGTPQYMSPEQATADRELDARSDVYSLAAMTYEMLTGEPPHTGSTAQAVIAAVLTEEPRPVTARRKRVPPHLAAAVERALAKLPADRWESAEAFSAALTNPTIAVAAARLAPDGEAAPSGRGRMLAGLATLTAAASILAVWGWLRPIPVEQLRLGIVFHDDEAPALVTTRRFALAPDGARIVYVGPPATGGGERQLWVRSLDEMEGRPLPGTGGAQAPFFSRDGSLVAFFRGDPGALVVVPVEGGGAQTLVTDSVLPWGGDWSDDGWVYFPLVGGRLARMREEGGAVTVVSEPDSTRGETFHEYPSAHPDGDLVLLQIWHTSGSDTEVGVLSLESGVVHPLAPGLEARFVGDRGVAYVTVDRQLMVGDLDRETLSFTGPARVVEEEVRVDTYAGAAHFDVSSEGHLVYDLARGAGLNRLVWVDRSGTSVPIDPGWTAQFDDLALAPEGNRLAVTVIGAAEEGIWVKELDRGPRLRLTTDMAVWRPTWAPDGREVTFLRSAAASRAEIWTRVADGSLPAEVVLAWDAATPQEVEWSPGGEWLVFRSDGFGGGRDLLGVRPGLDSVPRVMVGSRSAEWAPAISPDGRWLAYVSNEAGRDEVYVRPFPDTERSRIAVSVDGGTEPRWARDGSELFYRTPRGEMAARGFAAVGDAIRMEDEEVLFDATGYRSQPLHSGYDVAPDGRFLMVANDQTASSLVVVRHWASGLRDILTR